MDRSNCTTGGPSDPRGTKLSRIAGLREFFTYCGFAVCSLIAVVSLLEIASHAVLSLQHRSSWQIGSDIAAHDPSFSAFPWARECVDEQQRRLKTRNLYFPFRIWGNSQWHDSCVNNDVTALGTVRRTINPGNSACNGKLPANIWMLGGSTVYGTRIPDWATLPSYLSKQLNAGSNCVEVTNLGVEGYVTNQEVLLLIEKLKTGKVPDLVVFYDGFNDADVGTAPQGPGTHLGYLTTKAHLEGSLAGRMDFLKRTALWQLALEISEPLGRKGPPRVAVDRLHSSAVETLNNYEANLRTARALGREFGFRVCAFWQPAVIYGEKPQAPYEQLLLKLSSGQRYPFLALAPVYKEAEKRATGKSTFVFLADVFDAVGEPVYLDWVHLNPAGNEIVARAMAPYVEACLR